jgi:hypothetical protein
MKVPQNNKNRASFDLAIPFWGYVRKNQSQLTPEITACKPMFINALFTRAKL